MCLALLVTGRTLRETRGAEVDIAGDQALSYLAGSVGGTISQSYNRALGFNLVRIDPSLIAQEAEPTARLTLGQDITDKAGLVYSVNLKNSSDQIWIGRYDVTKHFSARVVRQSDASIRFQFQHDRRIRRGQAARSTAASRAGSASRASDHHRQDAHPGRGIEEALRAEDRQRLRLLPPP
jgi:hypothetical protein